MSHEYIGTFCMFGGVLIGLFGGFVSKSEPHVGRNIILVAIVVEGMAMCMKLDSVREVIEAAAR